MRDAIEELPAAASGELTTLNIKPLTGLRHKGFFRLRVGDFRVLYHVAGDEILVLQLDRKDDTTYSHLDRLVFMRRGEGVRIVDADAQIPSSATIERPKPARLARPTEHENPLTPFAGPELEAIGLSADAIALVREMRPTVDVVEALLGLDISSDTLELVADMWADPSRYLAIFNEGREPTPADARIAEEELAQRLRSVESSDDVTTLDANDFEIVLSRPIEEWMFYLHPSQTRIVGHPATGPSRVRGGPGTGKTVAALHRARWLVREEDAAPVLLTTFVRVLPKVWSELLRQFAPAEADSIVTRTVDSLAMEIVRDADGSLEVLDDQKRDSLLTDLLRTRPEVETYLGGALQLGREFETVIAGRGLSSLDEYIEVERSGRGSALPAAQRRPVWDMWLAYRKALTKQRVFDWSLLRLRALELAERGRGPRFAGIIVDEAQDLTATHVRLLMALDISFDHERMMLVGDGQQSIYPGGFTLRSVGLDVRGRSFLLRANWRNTQRVADAAEAVIGDVPFGDLEGEQCPRASADSPVPRRLGDPPELHLVDGEGTDEIAVMLVKEALEQLDPADIAVLGRKNKVWHEVERALRQADVPTIRLSDLPNREAPATGVRVGTFEMSKGLEFKVVFLSGPAEADWYVKPYWLTEDDDIREWWRTERRKLFVAMTRARDRLALIAGEPLPAALANARADFVEWHWP